jgi:class 3 adenylate cyclase
MLLAPARVNRRDAYQTWMARLVLQAPMNEILEIGRQNRKLAAILHADVVGFSRLMGEDEAGTHRALGELRRAVDPLIASHGGRIVGTAGDSLLADFSSVVDALNCAVEIQKAARAINDPIPPDRRLELRIGVNLGDVIVDGGEIFGDGVNIAARLQALARPGTVCISHTVYSTSGISSISITIRSAAITSRISPSPFALTR